MWTDLVKGTMSLVKIFQCECTPGKTYASASSYKRHMSTRKHIDFMNRDEARRLRIQLVELEACLSKLRHDYDVVSNYLRHPHRRQVTNRMKKDVAARASWKCEICSNTLTANYEVDHIQPLYLAGSNSIENLQSLCPECHRQKTVSDLHHS